MELQREIGLSAREVLIGRESSPHSVGSRFRAVGRGVLIQDASYVVADSVDADEYRAT